jgi:uncharacterized membrane protein YdjX (TVP38/TMEM64 family)
MVSSGPPGGGTWIGVATALGAVVTAIAVALAIPAVRDALGDALSGDTASVREDLRDSGAGGVALVVALGMLHTVVWYPAEILDAAAGYVYGFGPALPLVMGVWMASALAAYYIGRHAARPFLYKLAGEERFVRLERAIERGGASFPLACRLVPIVPFSLTGFVAGAAHVPVWRFTWTTAIGYVPITAYFIYLGSQLEGFSIEDPILWIGAVALLLALFGVRHLRFGEDDGPSGQAGSGASGSSAASRSASSRSSG